jgi:hypothetical protein
MFSGAGPRQAHYGETMAIKKQSEILFPEESFICASVAVFFVIWTQSEGRLCV